jgi:hypothetical protein
MSPLRYRPSDGKLLYIETGADAGKLAHECCCDDSGGPGGDGDCDCTPPLDFIYTVDLAGFTTDWDVRYNDAFDLYWVDGCTWYGEYDTNSSGTPDITITLGWNDTDDEWQVVVSLPGGCAFRFVLASAAPCTTRPPGTYAMDSRNGLCPSKAPVTVTCGVS